VSGWNWSTFSLARSREKPWTTGRNSRFEHPHFWDGDITGLDVPGSGTGDDGVQCF
jgi:hypothetical protein